MVFELIKKLTIEKLRLLADAGGVREVHIVGQGAGFALRIETRDDQGTLETALGEVRIFAKLDTAARTVHELGLGRAVLDLAQWQPGQKGA